MTPHPVGELLGELTRYARARIESDGSKPPGGASRVDESYTRGRGYTVGILVVVALVLLQATAAPVLAATSGAAASGEPSGMVGVPDGAISTNVPNHAKGKVPNASALRGATLTSSHADTLAVEITTRAAAQGRESACSLPVGNKPPFCDDPMLALNISDDSHSEGRSVAVPKAAIEDSLGYEPTTANVRHESGETYSVQVRERGSFYVFDVEHFSTNTVTFSGEVVVNGDPATDGSSYTYDVNSLDSVSNFSVDVTGRKTSTWANESGTVSPGGSSSISLGGNLQLTGPSANGNPTLEATASVPAGDSGYGSNNDDAEVLLGHYDGGSTLYKAEQGFVDAPEVLTAVDVNLETGSPQGTYDVYVVEESPDGTYGEGTKVISGARLEDISSGWNTLSFDTNYDVATPGTTVTVEFVTTSADASGTELIQPNLDTSGAHGDLHRCNGCEGAEEAAQAKLVGGINLQVADDDGHSADFGLLTDGDSATRELGVTTSSTSLDFQSGGTGSVSYTLHAEENYQTDSPTVEVNGETTSYSGMLSEGETVTLSTNESWIQEGTNRVNVSLVAGDVGLSYSHDARDDQSVQYEGETWSERYNVSRTWNGATTNATLTIPFAGEVVSNRELKVFINGTETAPTYSDFSGTKLEVGFGDLEPGTKARVVANGSKVVVTNGSIQVLEPTNDGDDLNTRFEITSRSDGFRIDVSGTSSADRVHYLANASYTPVGAYTRVSNGGSDQFVYAPNASAGSTVTARTLPLAVEPGNDVEIEVADPSEPRFKLRPSDVPGDSVTVTYYDTVSGTSYDLYDVDNDKIVASDTAESPVYFDHSDDGALYEILVADDGTSTSGGGDGGGGGSGRRSVDTSDLANTDPLANPILIIVVAAGVVLVGAWVASRTALSFRAVAGVGVLVGLGALETLQPGAVSEPVSGFLATAQTVGPALWLAGGSGALLLVYGVYQRFKPSRIIVRGGN